MVPFLFSMLGGRVGVAVKILALKMPFLSLPVRWLCGYML